MLPNISKPGDTRHEGPLHDTDSIMLLIYAVLTAARSQKQKIRYFSLTTIMTSYKQNNKSHKTASIPTVQNKHNLEESHATVTNQ